MIGQRFTRLMVVADDADRRRYWQCQCDCGVVKAVREDHLKTGKTLSCGCLARESATARAANMRSGKGPSHGLSKSRAYQVWLGMRQRCENPNATKYADYGGRGIAICDRWSDVTAFIADMGQPGPSMTLDRIDNNAGYSPENCRWASRRTQQNNRRVCRTMTHDGRTQTLSEWARETGIHRNTIDVRFKLGWTPEQVLSPDRHYNLDGLAKGAAASIAMRRATGYEPRRKAP